MKKKAFKKNVRGLGQTRRKTPFLSAKKHHTPLKVFLTLPLPFLSLSI